MTKYRWIFARKAEGFPIRLCCRVTELAPVELQRLVQCPRGRADTRRARRGPPGQRDHGHPRLPRRLLRIPASNE